LSGSDNRQVDFRGQRVGYTRVSSLDQNLDRQLEGIALDKAFADSVSGKDTRRPQLEVLLGFVREGDTVIVHSMDRLARNLDDLRGVVRTLTARGARVEFVKEQLTFTGEDSPMANLLLSVMGVFAEFERALIRERQREGIALAKQRGAYRGRRTAPRCLASSPDVPPTGNRSQRWPGTSTSAARRCTNTSAPPPPQRERPTDAIRLALPASRCHRRD